jgi:uncharacterized membrane protein YccC
MSAGASKTREARPDLRESVTHAVALAIACLISYTTITQLLVRIHSVSPSDDALGALWSVVATIFVYRATLTQSFAAALSRIAATLVSFVLCLGYLLLFPCPPCGMALLVGVGAILAVLLHRPDDAVTTGITTAVVMIVASLAPAHPWEQPILRLGDTIVGVGVGTAAVSLVLAATHR